MNKRALGRVTALFVSLFLSGLAGSAALAADLPIKAPPPPPTAPVSSWAGFYLGVNGGGGMANADFLDADCFACSSTRFQIGFGTAGGQAGYNWQWSSMVLGVEGDLNWASASQSRPMFIDEGPGPGTASFKFDAFGSVRARAGLAIDQTLFYVTAGPVWGHFNSVTSWRNNGANTPIRDIATDDAWHMGIAAGVGAEVKVAPHWSLRAEYLLLEFPDVFAHLVPQPPIVDASDARFRMNYGYSAQLARIGINYSFGEGGPVQAPTTGYVAKAPVYKAPPVSAVANWSGFYIGVNGGGGIATADSFDPDCFGLCADVSLRGGFGEMGGQVGYNWQWSSTVLGIEGDLNWSSFNQTAPFALNSNANDATSTKFDAFASIRGRAGLAADQTLVYLTAGPVWGHFNSNTLNFTKGALADTAPDDSWHGGIATGAGVEFMVTPQWTVRGEYLYLDFNDKFANFVPVIPAGKPTDATFRMNYASSAQVARIGVNYKWDAAGSVGNLAGTGQAAPASASWTGLYFGANAGGGVGNAQFHDPDCFFCADVILHRGFGEVGGQIGYNWQWRHAVFGLEGDLDWSSFNESAAYALHQCCPGAGTVSTKFDAFGSIRARAGLALGPTLIYATAGPAWGHLRSDTQLFNGGKLEQTFPDDSWHAGIAVGAGLEYFLAPRWTVRGEILQLDFKDKIANTVVHCCGADPTNTMHYASSAQLGRIGLNYHWD